jgi:hypothetical protein
VTVGVRVGLGWTLAETGEIATALRPSSARTKKAGIAASDREYLALPLIMSLLSDSLFL